MQFIVVKGKDISDVSSYSKAVEEVTGLKVLPIFDKFEVSMVDTENKSVIKL